MDEIAEFLNQWGNE
ncbi:hypothetical protein ACFEBQ_004537 [Escherichia coli]